MDRTRHSRASPVAGRATRSAARARRRGCPASDAARPDRRRSDNVSRAPARGPATSAIAPTGSRDAASAGRSRSAAPGSPRRRRVRRGPLAPRCAHGDATGPTRRAQVGQSGGRGPPTPDAATVRPPAQRPGPAPPPPAKAPHVLGKPVPKALACPATTLRATIPEISVQYKPELHDRHAHHFPKTVKHPSLASPAASATPELRAVPRRSW